ncbi:MAG: hypothetical protein ACP5JM_02655 [Thermoplasmata archaeon]
MLRIAHASNVEIFAREDSFITFMNSPFLSHRELKAVDIFPSSRNFEEMYSPVSGKIVYHRIHRMRKNDLEEHVTVVDCGGAFVKMLHIKPYLEEGEHVDAGETLGILYRSPYFRPWSDPHIHLEVREKNDYLRARGGIVLEIDECEPSGRFIPLDEYVERGTYLLRRIEPIRCGKFYGAGDRGIIDGGYPHYGYGLLLGTEEPILMGERIGELVGDRIVKFRNNDIYLKGRRMRGMGLSIYLSRDAYIKYIYP